MVNELEQGPLAITGDAIAQDEIVHATADVERVDLDVAQMRQGRSGIGERLIQAERAAQEAAGDRRRDMQRGQHGGQRIRTRLVRKLRAARDRKRAEGGKADIAKPLGGFGSGVFEIALPFRGDAFRVVYAVQIAEEIWVLHAFQKKSKSGIKTPQSEIDLIRQRLKRVKELL